jgi:ribonucleoside-triphosphate reductase
MKAIYPNLLYTDEVVQKAALSIIRRMRMRCDFFSEKYKLNFTLLATPAEGLSGLFVKRDKKRYGNIRGVTDREYYTNSFHVPVYENITVAKKIETEAPYHEFCNAGAITYIEFDGAASKNLEAFESVIRKMESSGIGYGTINHPIDRCGNCRLESIIDSSRCPACDSENIERIRRITGYLVGTMDRWNHAKTEEEKDRVKHGIK